MAKTQIIRRSILEKKLLTLEKVEELELLSTKKNRNFWQTLIDESCIEIEILKELLEENYGIQYCDIESLVLPREVMGVFGYDFMYSLKFVPFSIHEGRASIVMSNPLDAEIIRDIEIKGNLSIDVFFADPNAISRVLKKSFSTGQISSIESQFINESKATQNMVPTVEYSIENAPTVKMVDYILESAYTLRASDIHIEPFENMVRVRFRVDGSLTTWEVVDISLLASIVRRLKVISEMDISEKRLPQDGHFKTTKEDIQIDYRVSSMPTIYGEKIVIRLIYKTNSIMTKEDIGFFPEDIEKLKKLLKFPHGMILVTGPTGSGKTTTLASFIHELNKDDVNIVTIEDPVEKVMHGVNQININPKAGLDFLNVLKFILRQDPDIIMIGEIRDSQTAKIAIKASMTGHLVLSTLHTNDAISTVVRLVDMGIAPYILPSVLRGVISQRLVKRICTECKESYVISREDAAALHLSESTKVYKGGGCQQCNFTGYKGRIPVYEILVIDEEMKDILLENDSSYIKEHYKEKGMTFIRDNLIENIKRGNTTVEEMRKVAYGNEE